MLEVTTGAWVATVGSIAALLTVDTLLLRRQPHAVAFREAVGWSVFYVAVAVIFGVVLGVAAGWEFGARYFAGYAVEKSLSVDNLFVFMIIMNTFAVPDAHRQKVLTIGILVALAMRAILIALGSALLAAFSWMFLVFGLLLIVTAAQLFRHRDQDPTVADNAVVALARRTLPFTDRYDDGRLVTRIDGRRVLTPLFLVLLAIGTTDVVFALDSIPAVFGVTREPYIVFAANAFALLGLRALFFLVSGLLDRLVYLSTGLSLILAFIGVKLVLHYLHLREESVPEISIRTSLAVILGLLTATTVASAIRVRRDPTARAHAGSLRGHLAASEPQRGPVERST